MITSLKRLVDRVTFGRDSSRPQESSFTFSAADMELIDELIGLDRGQLAFKERPFTEEELIEAAWASLKIEEPDTTLEQVRTAIQQARSVTMPSSATKPTNGTLRPETLPA